MLSEQIKIITCPIHGLIEFNLQCDVDALAWNIIQTKEFQRLRHINQHGFSEFVYPGLCHSRFSHCVGCYHVCRKMLKQIFHGEALQNLELRAKATAIAALIHDIGHGAYSHSFEESMRLNGKSHYHEEVNLRFLKEDTEIRQLLLKEVGEAFLNHVYSFFSPKAKKDKYNMVLSSQLDADRLDYILRDKYMSGINTGGFYLDWLISCLEINPLESPDGSKDDVVSLNPDGGFCALEYLQARLANYRLLASHSSVRAMRLMLADLVGLTAKNLTKIEAKKLLLNEPSTLYFLLEDIPLHEFSILTDHSIWHSILLLARSKNPNIATLSQRILKRHIYKAYDVTEVKTDDKKCSQLDDFLSDKKIEYSFDILDITVYSYQAKKFNKIYIRTNHYSPKLNDIIEADESFSSFSRKFKKTRLMIKNPKDINAIENYFKKNS